MDTKPLAFGIAGFLLGGLVVSTAATLADDGDSDGSPTMSQMSAELEDKEGDAFDAAFIDGMIEHHQGAIDMAELAGGRAEHREVKQLSAAIIEAQRSEIADMERWSTQWGYAEGGSSEHSGH